MAMFVVAYYNLMDSKVVSIFINTTLKYAFITYFQDVNREVSLTTTVKV